MNPQNKFGLVPNAGMIYGVFDMFGPSLFPDDPNCYDYYFFTNPGLALHGSYQIGKKLRLGFRLRTEIMIGYEEDSGGWDPEIELNAALTLCF